MTSDLNILNLAASNDVLGLQRIMGDNKLEQIPQSHLALHCAAANNAKEMIKFLYLHGAPINRVDDHGYTPLHWALATPENQTIMLLLNLGADVSAEITTPYLGGAYSLEKPTVLNFIPFQWFKYQLYEARDGKYSILGKIQLSRAVDYLEEHHYIEKSEKDLFLNELGLSEVEMSELGQMKTLLDNAESQV